MAGVTADTAAIKAAASEFEGIASSLKQAIRTVEDQQAALQGALQGPAGQAAQQAFTQFAESGNRQEQLLGQISQNVQQAGVQYQAAADDAASNIGSMGF